jgi:hypothetical protein
MLSFLNSSDAIIILGTFVAVGCDKKRKMHNICLCITVRGPDMDILDPLSYLDY